MSNAKITRAFLTQEEATEQVLSPKNPDSRMAEQLSHAVPRDSLKIMTIEYEGSAVTAGLLRSPCQNAHKKSHFHISKNTDRAFFFRNNKSLVMVCLSSQQEMSRETLGPLQCKSVGFLSHLILKIKEWYLEAKENARHQAPDSNIPWAPGVQSLPLDIQRAGHAISSQCRGSAPSLLSTAEYSTAKATKLWYVLDLTLNRKILQIIYLVVSLTPSSPLSIDQHRSTPGDSVTQNHSCNLVSLTLVPPENLLLLPGVNYLCCYTPSRKLFRPVNKWVGPHFFSLLPFYAMRVFRQTGSLCTM